MSQFLTACLLMVCNFAFSILAGAVTIEACDWLIRRYRTKSMKTDVSSTVGGSVSFFYFRFSCYCDIL